MSKNDITGPKDDDSVNAKQVLRRKVEEAEERFRQHFRDNPDDQPLRADLVEVLVEKDTDRQATTLASWNLMSSGVIEELPGFRIKMSQQSATS